MENFTLAKSHRLTEPTNKEKYKIIFQRTKASSLLKTYLQKVAT